jgi:hypothetical protein
MIFFMDIGQDLRNIALATSILASLNNNLTHQQKVQRCILHHCQSKQNQADAYRVAQRRFLLNEYFDHHGKKRRIEAPKQSDT